MILKSMIEDESKLTLDCAHATVQKGSVLDLDDNLYKEPEVRNAIRMGLLKLVGKAPKLPAAAEDGKTRKFFNRAKTKLTFDCIKDYVEPDHPILIPESKLGEAEIANAIEWGYLEDATAKAKPKKQPSKPVDLDELTADDVVDKPVPRKRKGAKRKRPKKASKTAVKKVKPIAKIDDADAEEEDDDSMFKPSEVIVPKVGKSKPEPEPEPKPKPKPKAEKDASTSTEKSAEDRFGYLDIFGDEEGCDF